MLYVRNVMFVTAALCITELCAAVNEQFTHSLNFDPPTLSLNADNTTQIILAGCNLDDLPGKPALPIFGFSTEIPSDRVVDSILISRNPSTPIKLDAPLACAQPFFKPGESPVTIHPDPQIYALDALYPSDNRLFFRTDPTADKTLLSISFAPLQYNPLRNTLYYTSQIMLTVVLKPAPPQPVSDILSLNTSPSPLDPAQGCDYLIISTSNLISRAQPPWDFNALTAQREYSGLQTRVVSVEWIYDNYSGADQQQQIRHFLQDAYAAWSLKYLLIAGTHQMIPSRLLYIRVSSFFNDYIDNIPSDCIYYGCMDGSFDGNNNGRYGEFNDGDNGGDVDLTAEILVGRFPVENEVELAHMVRKTLHYDQAARSSFQNNGFVSEKVNFGSTVYGLPFMEEIRLGSTTFGRDTLGYQNSPYSADFITSNNLHDSETYLFTPDDMAHYLNNALHTINHIGHGTTFQCMKLNVLLPSDLSTLTTLANPFPYFIYSQACLSGAFDRLNCFAETIVTVTNAAAAVVMNSRNGWANTTDIAGHSQFFQRAFWNSAFRGNAVTLGEMNEASRRANLASVPSYGSSLWRWVYYELNLFGDPALPFMPALLNVPPRFSHHPLINTYNISTNMTIACEFNPPGIYDPESPYVVWNSSAGNGVVTQKMTRLSANRFVLSIPPQPRYAQVDYLIGASNRAGYVACDPVTNTHSFYITDELALLIAGSPYNIGVCEPDYGLHSSASGLVVNAAAIDLHYDSDQIRHRCDGFIGTGSVPTQSTNRFLSFQIEVDSILIWRWTKQFRVLINSNINYLPEQILWIDNATTFVPPPADPFIIDDQTNMLAFAGWQLNESRSPATPDKSLPQHPPITVTAPLKFTAWYIPADLDEDGNGIADWFEYRYFGTIGHDIFTDHDNDGFDLYQEYQDHSDPFDNTVFPSPPLIQHTPVSSTLNHSGPYNVNALISDTHAVSSANVIWRINADAWQTAQLNNLSNNLYHASIAGDACAGDLLTYRIEAEDPSGNFRATTDFTIFIQYPLADYSLLEDLLVVTRPSVSVITNTAYLRNCGNAPLNWSFSSGLLETVSTPNLTDLWNWDTQSIEQPWTISTNRAFSAPYALHGKLNSTAGSAHHASITLPSLKPGRSAILQFKYWINSENYVRVDPARAFDGGVVEFSLDNGATFQHLKGPYTHTIYGWDRSPWPDLTPCFSGQSEEWRSAVFDLTREYPDEAGFEGRNIIFRFVYGGDDNTDFEGWYIDDIRVSPAELPAGFSLVPPTDNPFMIPPGNFSELLLRNLPQIMSSRSEATTLFIDSNSPTNAATAFSWKSLIREEPIVSAFNATQITNGQGAVRIALQFQDADSEPLSLQLEWSDNRGHTWQPAALTSINISPPEPNSHLLITNNIVSITNSISNNNVTVTNQLSALWHSASQDVNIGWLSNTWMRMTIANPWFSSIETISFPVDNTPPLFQPGDITAEPRSEIGDYLISSDSINLTWPPALDTPPLNSVTYQIYANTTLLSTLTNLTAATLQITNQLDSSQTITLHCSDPLGNSGEPLHLALLILNPASDYDHDGMTTADEELAGTDASNPQSRFAITQCRSSNQATFTVSWNSALNRYYTVETSTTLKNPSWNALPPFINIPGNGDIITIEIPTTTGDAFFRVKVHQTN